MKQRYLVVLVILFIAMLTACGGGDANNNDTESNNQPNNDPNIKLENNDQTITFTNPDGESVTVTFANSDLAEELQDFPFPKDAQLIEGEMGAVRSEAGVTATAKFHTKQDKDNLIDLYKPFLKKIAGLELTEVDGSPTYMLIGYTDSASYTITIEKSDKGREYEVILMYSKYGK